MAAAVRYRHVRNVLSPASEPDRRGEDLGEDFGCVRASIAGACCPPPNRCAPSSSRNRCYAQTTLDLGLTGACSGSARLRGPVFGAVLRVPGRHGRRGRGSSAQNASGLDAGDAPACPAAARELFEETGARLASLGPIAESGRVVRHRSIPCSRSHFSIRSTTWRGVLRSHQAHPSSLGLHAPGCGSGTCAAPSCPAGP